ncbi:5'-methylthioadenosine nucleosidase [Marinilabilia salmonicolor]|jgi:5'-methylthioadenosine nucleosidase|uniref:phosphorylase family protein n=1 Tax=Marinilabilia salmonicolor TaxID=989 RepID=UPI000D06694F|nr:5'-methylthioadenosine nucleosidase [Marinilabilia salmonicolor]PRY97780.1 5'-methylthioadenosine nucleosidase [Marinilabilia salmonicolor]
MKNYTNICFVIAMRAEAQPLIDALQLVEDSSFCQGLPMRAWTGEYRNIQLSLVINGKDPETGLDLIGTQAATLATQFAIDKFDPQLIVNAGTAGAFGENGAKIGDVFLSRDHVVFHDRRVPIAGWDKQSIGYFPVLDVSDLTSLGFKMGVVTTGNSLDMPEHDEENIRKIGGEIKEMEAAAVAWVARLHQVPLFCVKAVTDLMDSGIPTHEEFDQNLKLATENLQKGVTKIIDFLAT